MYTLPELERGWSSHQAFEPWWPSSCCLRKHLLCFLPIVRNQLIDPLLRLKRKMDLTAVFQEDWFLCLEYSCSHHSHFALAINERDLSLKCCTKRSLICYSFLFLVIACLVRTFGIVCGVVSLSTSSRRMGITHRQRLGLCHVS